MTTSARWLFEAPIAHHEAFAATAHAESEDATAWLAQTPGWSAEAAVAAPPISHGEARPLEQTLYTPIPLGGESPARPLTGIFIPSGYNVRQLVDVLVYLQGHRTNPDAAWFRGLTIDKYWDSKRFPRWALREATNASGKNVVLVAPTLGPHSQGHQFSKRGGLDTYLDRVMAALSTYGQFRTLGRRPEVGNIILACHSGGGARMLELVTVANKLTSRVRECWAFDSLYGQDIEVAWYTWARRHPGARLYVHYGSGFTQDHSRKLAALARCESVRRPCRPLANVSVEGRTSLPHNNVPIEHWTKRLRMARWLADKKP